ncbi:thermostable hemolysin [Psychrobacter sanguinis]|uniref:Thermostable hemolysin n=1 Tax=Psychrobacter sanguinis TaxID=861445 RepID=A0A844LYC2_9GAMM|nr:thermostable hemolysin [Psychrobacter sanguinis]MUG31410.1 hypothetical protein [Psychrobacter sanguinis]
MSLLSLQQDSNTTFHIEALKDASKQDGQKSASELIVYASTQSAEYQLAQEFIAKVYEVSHGAKLSYFMPLLFSGFNGPNTAPTATSTLTQNAFGTNASALNLSVAIGIKPVTRSPVFLEQYLNAPIDVAIAQFAGSPIARERIVEIGNLASQSAGNARLMIAFLVFYLSALSKPVGQSVATTKADWAVCTGTNAVRHILSSMGIESHVVAKATIDAITSKEQQASWGSYYDNNPLVLAIDIAKAKVVCSPHYQYTEVGDPALRLPLSYPFLYQPIVNKPVANKPTANKQFACA